LNIVENYGTGLKEIALSPVSIKANDNRITVSGAANQVASVYSVTGTLVQQETLKSNDASFMVHAPAAIYIVKVGSTVQKVILK
jgi:hypothetical protein